eukprot:13881705-Alexandrium_andersonii.AAC.1
MRPAAKVEVLLACLVLAVLAIPITGLHILPRSHATPVMAPQALICSSDSEETPRLLPLAAMAP